MGDATIYEVLGRYVDGLAKATPVCIAYGRALLNGELITPAEKPVKFTVFMYSQTLEVDAIWSEDHLGGLSIRGTPALPQKGSVVTLQFPIREGEVLVELMGGREIGRALRRVSSFCIEGIGTVMWVRG
ncbi:hypothetical protein TK1647 [Thermococcus kodakarensis KOD1]|uniref:Uncharacterized protein n=1 Tax=Thermococcus kodakarensis (strain ATCC BAA-918 / JCM 12380 / KOD1) TaxID=69014 RepID=Q5JIT9_THEKO|nr:hypothetical protein [Thermococcus kodakarensis]WCN27577.1 hypothetical protein POG15_08390 [Thermococcus kodakarensis]WCN29868.1 hypothetical protein POG21_08380 [Thermococcus kodakarensis]BAD85836.1 hypothetical protein TK1647 [Thermococcus kodakarensis KOD1]